MLRGWGLALVGGLFLIALAGCGSGGSGRMTLRTGDTRSDYSEYFEFQRIVLDGKLRVHLLVTLGLERLPPDWRFAPDILVGPDGRLSRQARADGFIEEVYEIYFTNLGETPITLSQLELSEPQVKPPRRMLLRPDPLTVEPGQFVKTEPEVYIGSVYQLPTKPIELRFDHAGESQTIEGVAGRLRVDELLRARGGQARGPA